MRSILHKRLFLIVFSLVLFLLPSFPAYAIYKWQENATEIDINAMTQFYGITYERPEDRLLYRDNDQSGLAGIARVMIEAQTGAMTLEANAYGIYVPVELAIGQSSGGVTMPDAERSSALEWGESGERYFHTAVDRLNLRWSRERVDIILGRQPVNLATTFYFTPNDFFAPFYAQTFYRVYKPGVDAVRAEVRLGNLSQLSLISVLGYSPDEKSETGWGNSPDPDRTSYLGRVSGNLHGFEWAMIAGSLAEADVLGGAMQGEVFKWLGIRAEGHVAWPESNRYDSHAELAVGIEHHWENSLDVRIEYFYHGSGVGSVKDYMSLVAGKRDYGLYLGRSYAAMGFAYEFTPLIIGQMALLGNLTDGSMLSSFNAVYSLSNESELSMGLAVPLGREPEGLKTKSEFGMYPYTFNIEWRWYF